MKNKIQYFLTSALLLILLTNFAKAQSEDQCFKCHIDLDDAKASLFKTDIHHLKGISCSERLAALEPQALRLELQLAIRTLVERTAAATGMWAGDAVAERRLRRLARAHGSLVPSATEVSAFAPTTSVRFVPPPPALPRAHRAATWLAAMLAGLVLLVGAVGVLAQLTMYRPEVRPTTGSTTYEMRVELREGGGDQARVVQALWLSCRDILADSSRAEIVPAGVDQVTMTVEPRIAHNDDRRFVGCLEDVTLDRVRVDVVGGVDREGIEV